MVNAAETEQWAERHVREGQERVDRQRAVLARLTDGENPTVVRLAQELLAVLQQSLRAACAYIEVERRLSQAENEVRAVTG